MVKLAEDWKAPELRLYDIVSPVGLVMLMLPLLELPIDSVFISCILKLAPRQGSGVSVLLQELTRKSKPAKKIDICSFILYY